MDNFKLIYKILRHLEASLDCEVLDVDAISHSRHGVSYERWEQLLIMMPDSGYIKGLVLSKSLTDNRRHLTEPIEPEITISGLEYLEENKFMKKAANLVKGVVDLVR